MTATHSTTPSRTTYRERTHRLAFDLGGHLSLARSFVEVAADQADRLEMQR
jgi:hypothetical protein